MDKDVNDRAQKHATAVCNHEGKPLTCGKICFRSEGAPIDFRNIVLEPLDAKVRLGGE